MQQEHHIYRDGKIAGKAIIKSQGLYCQIDCTCHFPPKEIHRVFLRTLDTELNLGVCLPAGDTTTTRTKIATKYIDLENLYFYIVNNKDFSKKHLICDGCSFPAISKLRNGFLSCQEGSSNIEIHFKSTHFLNQNR